MADNSLFINGHITTLSFLRLENEQLSEESREDILLHLSNCESCMDRYMETLTEDTLALAPETLEANIISYIKENGAQKQHTKIMIMQFVKLAVAVSLMMVMLFSGVFEKINSVSGDIIDSIKAIEQAESQERPSELEPVEKEEKTGILFFDITMGFQDGFNMFAYKFNNGNRQ